jgi:hypothetical protein
MDEGARNVFLLLGYVVVGLGLLGGWPHWSDQAKAVYAVLFPLHALVAAIARDLWPRTDKGKSAWVTVIVIIAILLLLAIWG